MFVTCGHPSRARIRRSGLSHRQHQRRRLGGSGDTVTKADRRCGGACRGTASPSRWSSAVASPRDSTVLRDLRDSLEKLQLNDALVYQPEISSALGFGYRCGFLGLLHMEIIKERLEREFDLALIATAPSVGTASPDSGVVEVDNPAELPDPQRIDHRRTPSRSRSSPRRTTGHADGAVPATPRWWLDKLEYLSPESASSCTT